MADLSGYTPIYIRTTGDDATGDGSSGSPYATAQKGFDIAVATPSGNYVLDFGVGNFGGVTITQNWPARIAVRGAGAAQSFLGGIYANGVDGVIDWETSQPLAYPTSAFSGTILSNKSIHLGDITSSGGSATEYQWGNMDPMVIAGNGGAWDLSGCVWNNLGSTGGSGLGSFITYEWGGGVSGAITLDDCACGSIQAFSGSTSTGYSSPAPGPVTLTDTVVSGGVTMNLSQQASTASSITLLRSVAGQVSGDGVEGPPSNVTLTDSQVQFLSSRPGPHTFAPHGGTIVATRSQCGAVDVSANPPTFAGNGSGAPVGGGYVTLNDSVADSVLANGADGVDNEWDIRVGSGGGGITLNDSVVTGLVSAVGGSFTPPGEHLTSGPNGTVTLNGSTPVPNEVNGIVNTAGLRKGRGVNGSNILGIA